MKKKIILALVLVSAFVCLFAISASAATEVDGIWYNLTVTDAEAKIGTAEVTADNATQCTLTDVKIPSYVEKDGITYTVTTIAYHAFSGAQGSWGKNQTIKSLYIPETVTSIGGHFLRECKSIETVVIKAKNPNGITLPDAEFYQCTSLVSVDMSESDITSFGQYTFYSCSSLTSIKFPPKLKTIGRETFRFCSSITTIDLLDTKVESIGNFCFNSCSQLTKLRLSTTLKSIAGNAIQGVKITELVLPHGFTTTTGDAIPALSSLYMMVFPELDETSSFSGSTFYGTYPELVLYAGDKDSCEKYLVGTADNKKLLYGYNVLPISEYDSSKTYTGKNLFYGATTCSNCNGLYASEEAQFVFTDYISDMKYGKLCSHCEKVATTKTVDAMFTYLGYSAIEDGTGAISIKYIVNKASIETYFAETEKVVNFGMYAATKDALKGGDILDNEGNPNAGAFRAKMDSSFCNIELKLTGFTTEELKATKFAIGAYVEVTSGETTEYVYLEKGEKAEGDKYQFVSYNDVLELA